MENMIQRKKVIEASKKHWSELDSNEEEDLTEINKEVFQSLKEQWGSFFFDDIEDRLVIGDKIAEGGQAEIFDAAFKPKDGILWVTPLVLKMFKEGYHLRGLESQWPLSMLQHQSKSGCGVFQAPNSNSTIWGGMLLKNGRFAFLMLKASGEICERLLIVKCKKKNNQGPPMPPLMALGIMLKIAEGMEALHKLNIIHRDLKAANVLLFRGALEKKVNVSIADFECSCGVIGTGFWRAPEILFALQNRCMNPEAFTEKADVYSFGMTCYEILTGFGPFEDHPNSDYGLVLSGRRPPLPEYVHSLDLLTLLDRCWHASPAERPTFTEIVEIVKNNQLFKAYENIHGEPYIA